MPVLRPISAKRPQVWVLLGIAASIMLAAMLLSCGGGEDPAAPQASPADTPAPTATAPPTEVPATQAPAATQAPEPTSTSAPAATTAPEPTPAPEATEAPDDAMEPGRLFAIAEGSQALFKVDEVLRGVDVVVSLETEDITGAIDLEGGTAILALDLHTLVSDQARRDRYVRERLFPSQPVTSVDFADLGDIPDSFYETGEELSVTLPATVHVNGVDAVLDFEITARLDSETDLVVLGVAEFTWADFGMTAPVSSIFTVADDVRAELLLYAKAN